MNSSVRVVALVFFAALFSMGVTSEKVVAGVVFDLNYNLGSNPNYDQADNSAITTISYPAATGLDGSTALQVQFDTTGVSPSDGNPWFSTSYFTNLSNSFVAAGVSDDADDYVYSFDYSVEGFAAGQSSVFTQVRIQLDDARFESSLNATATPQTFSMKLSDMTLSAGTFSAADLLTGTRQARVAFLDISNRFGQDTDNFFRLDNFRLTEVTAIPEPSSMLMFAAVGMVCLLRRRRS